MLLALTASHADAQPSALPKDAVARLGHTRLRHADRPTCVAFAPDGKTFLTGGDDGAIRVWSVATGEQVNMIQKPGAGVSALKLTHGGKKLAVQFGAEAVVRLYDAATLREVGGVAFVGRHKFDFSADGGLMIAIDFDGNATVTEVAEDLPKLELEGAHLFAFRPDGKAIAVADKTGTATVHLLTGGKPTFTLKQDGTITGLSYSPDGSRLAVGSRSPAGSGVVRVFESERAKPVAEIADTNIPRAWLSADRLVLGNGNEAGVYDLAKKEWIGRAKGITGEFAVSPDGTKLAATGTGLRVRLYDLATGNQLHAENDTYPDPTLMVGSADGRELFHINAATAYQYTVGADGARAVGALPGRAVAAALGGGTLAVATPEGVLVYANFDPFKRFPAKPTTELKNSAGAKTVAVSADGKRLAWGADGGTVTVCGADGGGRRELPVTGTTVLALGFNPAGDRLGVLGRDPFMRVWNVAAGQAGGREVWKARVQRGLKGAIAFSPDGRYVTAGSTGQLLVFDAADGKDDVRTPLFQCERYADHGPIHQAAFSPDSRLLIVGAGGMSGRVEVWELATRGLARSFSTGYGGISRLCAFPDGSRIASAGAEEAVTVWDATFRTGKGAPKPSEVLTAAADLADARAEIGHPAAKLLGSAGDAGARQLALVLKETLANDTKLKELIKDLGSETFGTREAASRTLVAQGERARPALRLALTSDDPEVRSRAREVLERLSARPAPAPALTIDQLRLSRAAQALEEIGTPEAKRVLADIAAYGGRAGEEARAALKRLK